VPGWVKAAVREKCQGFEKGAGRPKSTDPFVFFLEANICTFVAVLYQQTVQEHLEQGSYPAHQNCLPPQNLQNGPGRLGLAKLLNSVAIHRPPLAKPSEASSSPNREPKRGRRQRERRPHCLAGAGTDSTREEAVASVGCMRRGSEPDPLT
jgi:hypothetical protein